MVALDNEMVTIYQNIGTNGQPLGPGSFAPPITLGQPGNGVSGSPYRVTAADLDGDGKPELLVTKLGGNRVSIFHNVAIPGTLNTNSFEPAFALIAGSNCVFAKAADLDGDGRLDVVAVNYADSTLSLFKNTSSPGVLNAGSFAAPVTLPSPSGPLEVAIADLDGDGKSDLAAAGQDSGTVSIFQNQTTNGVINAASFVQTATLPSGQTTGSIRVADLDGNGRLDLVVGSILVETISTFPNTNVVAIAAGFRHNLALRADGTVAAWGDNVYGQATVPVGVTNALAIACGDAHSLALLANNTVAAWGNDFYGQVDVPAGLTNVVAIACGYEFSMALQGNERLSRGATPATAKHWFQRIRPTRWLLPPAPNTPWPLLAMAPPSSPANPPVGSFPATPRWSSPPRRRACRH